MSKAEQARKEYEAMKRGMATVTVSQPSSSSSRPFVSQEAVHSYSSGSRSSSSSSSSSSAINLEAQEAGLRRVRIAFAERWRSDQQQRLDNGSNYYDNIQGHGEDKQFRLKKAHHHVNVALTHPAAHQPPSDNVVIMDPAAPLPTSKEIQDKCAALEAFVTVEHEQELERRFKENGKSLKPYSQRGPSRQLINVYVLAAFLPTLTSEEPASTQKERWRDAARIVLALHIANAGPGADVKKIKNDIRKGRVKPDISLIPRERWTKAQTNEFYQQLTARGGHSVEGTINEPEDWERLQSGLGRKLMKLEATK